LDERRVFDNESGYLRVEQTGLGQCGTLALYRTQVLRQTTTGEQVLGYIDDRCVDPATSQADYLTTEAFNGTDGLVWDDGFTVEFDPHGGELLFYVERRCHCWCSCQYQHQFEIWAIGGFATIAEVLSTYDTDSSTLSFTVPLRPEGFQYADYFDTYYGDLATVGDWSQAQPLHCG
jgi:hypothetical protein